MNDVPVSEEKSNQYDAAYWNERHKRGDTPWKINYDSPALTTYFDQLDNKNINILIPGAGHEHEALYLLDNGFLNVTVCDISTHAIANLHQAMQGHDTLKCIQSDFFDLSGTYDLIVEQTFFCALPPEMRNAYVEKMHHILTPGGTLCGLLFASKFENSGPPFGGDIEEYKSLFTSKLHIKTMEMCYNSIAARSGNELFFICKKTKR